MLISVVVLFVIAPRLSLFLVERGDHAPLMMDAIAILEKCNFFLMHTFTYVYVAFFGSCLASFLNVVAWRVPRGRSILGSSHCPKCDHKLSLKDNIPVWGWLKNEGRCRHCQSPIAQRYLWVEVLLGVVFLVLFIPEIVFGGANLPIAPQLKQKGIELVLFAPNAQLLQTFGFHVTLMSILFTVAAISSESFRIPLTLVGIASLILVAIAYFSPVVLQVSWRAFPTHPANETLVPFGMDSALTLLLGWGVGIALGIVATLVANSAETANRSVVGQQLAVSFSLVGLALGWQAVLVTLLIWLLLTTFSRSVGRWGLGSGLVMAAALVQILTWSLIFAR